MAKTAGKFWRRVTFAVACLGLVQGLSACQTYARLDGHAMPEHRARYNNDRLVMLSPRSVEVVASPQYSIFKSNIGEIALWYTNKTTDALTVGPEIVQAYGEDGRRLAVLSVDEIVRRAEEKAQGEQIIIALAGGMQAYSAGQMAYRPVYSTQSFSGNATAYDVLGSKIGSANFSGNSTTVNYVYDQAGHSAEMSRITNQTQALSNQVAARYANQAEYARKVGLRRNTVSPGQSVGGIVFVELPAVQSVPQKILLVTNVNGELHRFVFTYSKA